MKVALDVKKKGDAWVPWFYCTEVEDVLAMFSTSCVPMISMSRNHCGCYTKVTQLQTHNDDAPGFKDKPSCYAYISRVQKDVQDALNGKSSGIPSGSEHMANTWASEGLAVASTYTDLKNTYGFMEYSNAPLKLDKGGEM